MKLTKKEALDRLDVLNRRHTRVVRGGKAVCAACTRGHDMRSLVMWPCPDAKILEGRSDDPKEPTTLVLRVQPQGVTEIRDFRTNDLVETVLWQSPSTEQNA